MLLGQYDIDAMQNRQEAEDNAPAETVRRRPLIVTKDNARSTLMTKMNRSGVMVSGRSDKRTVRRGLMTRGNSFTGMRFGQHVVVKIRYVKHKKAFTAQPGFLSGLGSSPLVGRAGGAGSFGAGSSSRGGGASALRSHVKYVSRGDAGKDGEKAVLFNATGAEVEADVFVASCEADRHHWRFIISPENGHQIEDFEGYVRGIMDKVETDLGTKLEWVSAVHYDTDNPHAHVIVRGKNDKGEDLVIGQDYIKEGVRRRAQEVATELLGERSLEEIQQSLAADVDKMRVTSLDRFIEKQASLDKERKVDVRKKQNFDKSLHYEGLIKGRLKFLGTAGLADENPPGVFRLKEGYKETLAQVAEKDDVIKRLYKNGKGIDKSQLDGLNVYSIKSGETRVIEGYIVDKGLHEEMMERKYVVVRDMSSKLHYVPVAEFKGYDKLEKGALVKLAPGGQSTGKADLNIAEQAQKNGGVYDRARHQAHIERRMQFIPAQDRPKYLELHQVRLETLVKNDVVKDLGEGRYEVPADVVERGAEITREMNAKENKRFYPKLEVLSARSPSMLIAAQKRTWLDMELQQQAKGTPSLSAYDGAISKALADRKAWLVQQGIGFLQSNGEFALRDKALQKLDLMEVKAAGGKLAEKLGLEFRDATVKPDVTLRYQGYIALETGVWTVVTKGSALYLMPVKEEPGFARGEAVVFRQPETGKQLEIERAPREPEKEPENDRGRGRGR
jgi:type IV secretory pathway VirD2 relaxase